MKLMGEGLLVSVKKYTNKEKQEVVYIKVLSQKDDFSDCELLGMTAKIEDYDELVNNINCSIIVCGTYSNGYARYDEYKFNK